MRDWAPSLISEDGVKVPPCVLDICMISEDQNSHVQCKHLATGYLPSLCKEGLKVTGYSFIGLNLSLNSYIKLCALNMCSPFYVNHMYNNKYIII